MHEFLPFGTDGGSCYSRSAVLIEAIKRKESEVGFMPCFHLPVDDETIYLSR